MLSDDPTTAETQSERLSQRPGNSTEREAKLTKRSLGWFVIQQAALTPGPLVGLTGSLVDVPPC